MQSNHNVFFSVTAAELEYFVKISDWWRALNEAKKCNASDDKHGNGIVHIIPEKRLRKLAIISEFEAGVFVDCVVEVSES